MTKIMNKVVGGKGPIQRYTEFLDDLRSEIKGEGWVALRANELTSIHGVDVSTLTFLCDTEYLERQRDPTGPGLSYIFRAKKDLSELNAKQMVVDMTEWRKGKYQNPVGRPFANRNRLSHPDGWRQVSGEEAIIAELNASVNQTWYIVELINAISTKLTLTKAR